MASAVDIENRRGLIIDCTPELSAVLERRSSSKPRSVSRSSRTRRKGVHRKGYATLSRRAMAQLPEGARGRSFHVQRPPLEIGK